MGIYGFLIARKQGVKLYSADSSNHAKQIRSTIVNNPMQEISAVGPVIRLDNKELPLMFKAVLKKVDKNAKTPS
jgi:hypothetical protein